MQFILPFIGLLIIIFSKELIIINDNLLINLMFLALLILFVKIFTALKETFDSLRLTDVMSFVKTFVREVAVYQTAFSNLCLLVRRDLQLLNNLKTTHAPLL